MLKKLLAIIAVILFVVAGVVFVRNISKVTPFLLQLIFNRDISVSKTDGSINILLLGIGGGNHEGPNLTDTIIFASINPDKNSVVLVSIPRDLWVPELKQKINTIYAIGEDKRKGGGLILTKAILSRILKQEINYGFRIDFDGFIKAVDAVGGLDVNVDKTFDDYEYPVEGKESDPCGHKEEELQPLATASSQLEVFPCRYKHLHFDFGLTHMDGKTALEFVRSRHAQGEEGTDFARSKRQEKVILAFKEKIFSAGTLLNPTKIMSLYSLLKSSIDTDIPQDQFDDFVRLAGKMKQVPIKRLVLDQGDEELKRYGLLDNPPLEEEYKSQWVLIPRIGNGDFTEVQDYVDCEIEIGNCVLKDTRFIKNQN